MKIDYSIKQINDMCCNYKFKIVLNLGSVIPVAWCGLFSNIDIEIV